MKSSILLLASLLTMGCGSKPPGAAAKAEPKSAAAPKKAEVTLDAVAQRHAGIGLQTVRPEAIRETIDATGQLTVNEDQTWSVGALQSGRVASVSVKVGDVVRDGQVLARMHSHDVHDSRASYKTALAELARLRVSEQQAERMHDRAGRLLELKAASRQDVEMASSELQNARTAVENARTEVEKERVHLTEFLDVPLNDNPASATDDFIPIKAPAAGVVIERKVTPGTVVTEGQEVFRITAASTIWMLANVSEVDLADLRVGQPVRVLVRAYPKRVFTGRILRLGEALDPTTRTLQVRVQLPNPGGMLKPEMYASAEVERRTAREALFVPESAAQDLNGNRVVFVKTGEGRFEPRPVEIGRRAEGRMEVLAGVRAGDEVVVKGSFILKSQLLRQSMQEE